MCGTIIGLLETDEESSLMLDGKCINLFGVMKIKSIDFWLKIEDIYSRNCLVRENEFKLLEALIGFAMVHRG